MFLAGTMRILVPGGRVRDLRTLGLKFGQLSV